MTLGFVARAMRKGLTLAGEPSSLRGSPCGNVHLELNVDLYAGIGDNANDNHVVRYHVASIDVAYAPKVGDVLVHPDGTFKLDRMIDDHGVVRQFRVVAA